MTREELLKLIEEHNDFWVVVSISRPYYMGGAVNVKLAKESFSNIEKYNELMEYCTEGPGKIIIDSNNRLFLHPFVPSGTIVFFNPENFPDNNIYVKDVNTQKNDSDELFYENGMFPRWITLFDCFGYPVITPKTK